MGRTLWHYGDSFGCWGNPTKPELEAKKGFSEYIAEYYNSDLKHHAVQGASNDEIINRIISDLHRFKPNDILIINWSFFPRIPYVNKYGVVKNINNILNELSTDVDSVHHLSHDTFEFYNKEYFDYILFDKTRFLIEENMIIWKRFINPILIQIQNHFKCFVINSFNDVIFHADYNHNDRINDYYSYWGISPNGGGGAGKPIVLHPELQNIKWNNDESQYVKFLNDNGYYGEGEDVHYKFGVQEKLSKEWISRIDTQFFNLKNKEII